MVLQRSATSLHAAVSACNTRQLPERARRLLQTHLPRGRKQCRPQAPLGARGATDPERATSNSGCGNRTRARLSSSMAETVLESPRQLVSLRLRSCGATISFGRNRKPERLRSKREYTSDSGRRKDVVIGVGSIEKKHLPQEECHSPPAVLRGPSATE